MDMLAATNAHAPSLLWVWPFVAILLSIALLPLIHRTAHWWENNASKLFVSLVLAAVTLLYYGLRDTGIPVHAEHASADARTPADAHVETHPESAAIHVETRTADGAERAPHTPRSAPGLPTVVKVLEHAVLAEYVPFIVLLFSLYVITGGILVRGDLRATPLVNTTILATGGVLASFVGTTGAAMLLIRFLLKTNAERRRKVHTVVFFIFIVANIGGTLLPIGDPPLFLGYLRGVPFLWTLHLWKEWAFMLVCILSVYLLWDIRAYRHEAPADIRLDETQRQPLRVAGLINVLWLLGVVVAVGTLDPSKAFPGSEALLGRPWHAPPYLREGVQLLMVVLSLATTPRGLRPENQFNYVAIGEVAALFIGIFITMQVPIEILHARGAELGLTRPWQFFWATGMLSSFLDNAPTYVVYFETAVSLPHETIIGALGAVDPVHLPGGRDLPFSLLAAISCGAVFMGANTYIGNGPNFMVKAIAEQSGVKMPSFFGYMLYSMFILIPLFVVLTLVFFR
ncbi:MAG: sodium:proton antiporter [Planctomycetota bacterium]